MEEMPRQSSVIDSSSVLFEKAIPVRIKAPSEDRHAELTIRIIMGLSKHRRSTKVLQVQITNELDPFFLYSLEVNDEDFQSLKVEQCILVDFGTFPHKFIELLEHCIKAGTLEAPRFLAILSVRTGDSTFSVVETNQFKHLSHLSLCFRQGNDSTIKSYLAGRLAEYKGANIDLHEKLRRTLESLENSLQDVSKLQSELAEFKDMHSLSTSDLKAKHTMELAHEKEKAMQECIEMKAKLERERADMEYRLCQRAELQENHVAELDKQLKELGGMRHTLEMRVAELKTKVEAAEKDLQERQHECDELRTKNASLDNEFHKSSKQLNENLIRLAAVEQEVQSKNELISNMSRQLESQASHRAALELSLKDAQTAAERAEEKAAAGLAEANSCKQTTEKLQGELKSSKAKLKLKAQVTAQQDALLHERQATIEKNVAENNALRQEIAALKLETDSLRRKADELKEKSDESQELLKSNQQMIQWLNQQLTDAQLGNYGVSSRYRSVSSSSRALAISSLSCTGGLPGNMSTSPKNLLLPSNSAYSQPAHPRPSTPNSLISISSKSCTKGGSHVPSFPHGVNRVVYRPPQVQISAGKSNPPSQGPDDAAESNNERLLTVDLARNGLPKPQLSFTGLGAESNGERFASRLAPVISTN